MSVWVYIIDAVAVMPNLSSISDVQYLISEILMSENFFDEQTEQSQIKSALVADYFPAFMRIIGSAQNTYGGDRIAYIDLFAGPGRYKDGAKSTPVLIVEKAIADEDMRNRLVAVFNDKDEGNVRSLETALRELPGYDSLRYRPEIWHGEIGDEIVKTFEANSLIPTLFFVDPWGYKGMTLKLINSVLKDWGCDCFFFFNYSRVNSGLQNDAVEKHIDALFGKDRANSMRSFVVNNRLNPIERESFVVEEMCKALKEMGGKFVLPFRFHNRRGSRITHHLFFVSKHFRAYDVMKSIMRKHCTGQVLGPVNFEFNPADRRQPTLFELSRPLEDLGGMILSDFAGRTFGINELYENHSVGKPFVLSEYRSQLIKLEIDGLISCDPPLQQRRKKSLPEHVRITIPHRSPS